MFFIATGIAGLVFDPDDAMAHIVEQIELFAGAEGALMARQVIQDSELTQIYAFRHGSQLEPMKHAELVDDRRSGP